MRSIFIALAAASTLAGCTTQTPTSQPAQAQRPSDATSEAYMRKAEEDWAALAVKPMPGLLDRILADDYVAVSSKGDVRDKATQVKLDAPDADYASSKLDYAHYRHFGDTVIAQGQESLQRKDGKADLTLIWTDVWMWRRGKWQVVASQDSVLPAKT
jgi:uncharacterized protein YceK